MIGPGSVLAWVMAVGLALDAGAIVLTRAPVTLNGTTLWYMAVAGFGNAFGLLLLLSALRLSKVGLATSITSTEGAVAAVYSLLTGEHLPVVVYRLLAVTVAGVVLATFVGTDCNSMAGVKGSARPGNVVLDLAFAVPLGEDALGDVAAVAARTVASNRRRGR